MQLAGITQANQTARRCVVERLGEERRKSSSLQFKLYKVERESRTMEGKVRLQGC